MDLRSLFHPAVADWFESRFARATQAQADAWPLIKAGRHTLIAAPTGSGKTFAAFLAAIDDLVRQGIAGDLRDETLVVYVSPLKALSNDIQKNLQEPLAGIRENLRRQGLPDVDIRTWVRTGDTPAGERQKMNRRPHSASSRASDSARCEPRLLAATAWISSTITVRVVASIARPDSEPSRM